MHVLTHAIHADLKTRSLSQPLALASMTSALASSPVRCLHTPTSPSLFGLVCIMSSARQCAGLGDQVYGAS